jgi:putative endonuclease
MSQKTYYVYILSNRSRMLYVGMTNNLFRRIYEHKEKINPGFSSKYNLVRLVYFEETDDVNQAIQREKQIKGWLRRKKIMLIERENPGWIDLADGWY